MGNYTTMLQCLQVMAQEIMDLADSMSDDMSEMEQAAAIAKYYNALNEDDKNSLTKIVMSTPEYAELMAHFYAFLLKAKEKDLLEEPNNKRTVH